MSFIRSGQGKTFLLACAVTLVFYGLLMRMEWNRRISEAHENLVAIQSYMMQAANDQLLQHEAILKLLGRRIQDSGGLSNGPGVTAAMDQLLSVDPAYVAYGIANPAGELVIRSANLRNLEIPSLLASPNSRLSFQQALESEGLSLGNTYYFAPLERWIVPLRYVMRGAGGEVEFVVTVGIDIDSQHNPWRAQTLLGGTGLETAVILKQRSMERYRLIYAEPSTYFGASREEAYGRPLTDAFVSTLSNALYAKYGVNLAALEEQPRPVGYINETPGVPSFYAVPGFSQRFDYYLTLRAPLTSIREAFTGDAIKWGSGFLLALAAVLTGLYRQFRSEQRFRDLLLHKATHDQLTELPDRYYLDQLLRSGAYTRDTDFSLCFVDLDNFKFVNDNLGHSFGDRILRAVAGQLQKQCGDGCVLCRTGGDEFLVILDRADNDWVETFAQRLLYAVQQVTFIDNVKVAITASIGIALGGSGEDFDELLKRADLAMYASKRRRNAFTFYQQEMGEKIHSLNLIDTELKAASIEHEMSVVYQPQVLAATGELRGAEALLRWASPELGNVSPVDFIPAAERNGMIVALGEQVVRTAVDDLRLLKSEVHCQRVSLNVSIHQLIYGDFASWLNRYCVSRGLSPGELTVELTEGTFIEEWADVRSELLALRDAGFGVSIDDFGTGYSSLYLLGELPITEVKIDKSFVSDIARSDAKRAIVESVIRIAEVRGLDVVAEGVETAEQVKLLTELGCHILQGYYFSMPQPLDKLRETTRSITAISQAAS